MTTRISSEISLLRLVILILVFITPSALYADFEVKQGKWGNAKEKQTMGYGNAMADSFRKSIVGGEEISEVERTDIKRRLPEPYYNRAYIRAGFNLGGIELRSIKNKSTSTNLQDQKVNKESNKKNHFGVEFAGGYVWEQFRAEIEWLLNTKIDYNQNPLFKQTGTTLLPNDGIISKVEGSSLLATFYYDFLPSDSLFRPYLSLTAGGSVSTVKTTGTSLSTEIKTEQKKKTNLAFTMGLGAGIRIHVHSQIFVQFGLRYLRLGDTVWRDTGDDFKLQATRQLTVASFSVIAMM